jgi:hypothetical protein
MKGKYTSVQNPSPVLPLPASITQQQMTYAHHAPTASVTHTRAQYQIWASQDHWQTNHWKTLQQLNVIFGQLTPTGQHQHRQYLIATPTGHLQNTQQQCKRGRPTHLLACSSVPAAAATAPSTPAVHQQPHNSSHVRAPHTPAGLQLRPLLLQHPLQGLQARTLRLQCRTLIQQARLL